MIQTARLIYKEIQTYTKIYKKTCIQEDRITNGNIKITKKGITIDSRIKRKNRRIVRDIEKGIERYSEI